MEKIDSAEPAEQKNKLVSPYVSLESLLNYLLNDLKKYWSTKNDTEPQILIFIFSPLRKPSQKNEIKKEKYEKEKTEFKKEITVLKLYNKEKTGTKNSFSSKQNTNSKNMNLASTTSGSQNETVQLLTIINFIQDTMAILSSYSEQLKTQLDFSLTQQDK